MNGEEALREYGYVERKGLMSLPAKPNSQHWQRVGADGQIAGSVLRAWGVHDDPTYAATAKHAIEASVKRSLEEAATSVHVGQGEAPESAWLRFDGPSKHPIPHKVLEKYAATAGLNMANPQHMSLFDWVWPDAEIVRIYAAAIDTRAEYLREREARQANLKGPAKIAAERENAAEDEGANVISQIDLIARDLSSAQDAEEAAKKETRKAWWHR